MAIGANYVDDATLKHYMGLADTDYDAEVAAVASSASREVERFCHRQFNKDAAPAARKFIPTRPGLCITDDFYTTTGLIVQTDDSLDGTFARTWAIDVDYELQPLNGVVDQIPGFPFWKIVAIGQQGFPGHPTRATVKVTASWGWATVPAPVIEAVKMIASDSFQYKDTRMGVAGADQFGSVVRIKENGLAACKLKSYVRGRVICR